MAETEKDNGKKPYKGGWIQDFLVSLVFLTRIPVRPGFSFDIGALNSASRTFPLIGLIVGGISGTIYLLMTGFGLPGLVAAFLAIAAQILMTGALHEDAIGDIADGFGGGETKEKKLEIMKDSRVGTYAVVMLILVIGLKAAALAQIFDPLTVFSVLVVSASVSRGLMGWAMYLMPAAKETGLGKLSGQPELTTVLWATTLILVIAVLVLDPYLGAVAFLAGIVGAVIVGFVSYRQIGGQTGDVLGAIQQISELFIILACLMALT